MVLLSILASGLALGVGPASADAQDVAWVWPGAARPSPQPVELAVLTQTIRLGEESATLQPLRTPLIAAPGTRLTPVVHVQASPATARLARDQAQVILAQLVGAARQSTSGWVQLDFEAPGTMREAWRQLVAEARRAIPTGTRLSVTTIASRCIGGAWLDDLEADEVVPMVYALGPASRDWQRTFRDRSEALHPRCRAAAAGFSVEVPPPPGVRSRYARRYWFHEQSRRPYSLPSTETP